MQTGLETKATLLLLLECNAKCPFCSVPLVMQEGVVPPAMPETGASLPVVRSAREHKRTLAEAKADYDALVARGVRRVNLGGGEPTTWPDLPALIEYGHQVGLEEQLINSNGMRFRNPAYAQQLVAARPSGIVLSLFGATPETHDASFGVPGLFHDVTRGVANLLAAIAEQPPEHRAQLTAQFTLHRWNHAELPEMFRYWYAQGIRQFSLKLLRDSPATERHTGEDTWFFDLAQLRAPLEASLDWLNFKPDVSLSMAEVLCCLLSPTYFGFVLADLGSNPNLMSTDLRVTRLAPATPIERFDTVQMTSECEHCDVQALCQPLRTCHLQLFTGRYAPIHVADRIATLARRSWTTEEALRLRPLLQQTAVLDRAGVPDDQRASLRSAYLAALRARPDLLAIELFRATERERLMRHFQSHPALPAGFISLRLSELGASGALRGDHRAVLARLRDGASAAAAPKLQFLLDRTNFVVGTEWALIFSFEREGQPMFAFVIDDRRITEADLISAIRQVRAGS